jgi:PAS domain S-box-containing protein
VLGHASGVAAPPEQAGEAALDGRVRLLADRLPDMAWIADTEGRLLWSNRRLLEYLGYPSTESVAAMMNETAGLRDLRAILQRCCQPLNLPWQSQLPIAGVDGERRWFLSRGTPILDDEGRLEFWCGTHVDVTDQRHRHEELAAACRAKDEVLAVVAHECRTPLTAILTAVKLLEVKARDDQGLKRLCESIRRQGLQVSALIDDLLDATRIASGKLRLVCENIDIRFVVRQALDASTPLIEHRRHTVQLSLPEEPIYVRVDVLRLSQVIGNLLSNAAKYMGEGGRIEVSVDTSDAEAVLSVRDHGVGITPDMLERIFDRFIQIGDVGRRRHDGLGIGLALVKTLVERHGGRVEARSGGANQGTEFLVYLPRIVSTHERAATANPHFAA